MRTTTPKLSSPGAQLGFMLLQAVLPLHFQELPYPLAPPPLPRPQRESSGVSLLGLDWEEPTLAP